MDDLSDINQLSTLYRADSQGKWVPQIDHYLGVKPSPRDMSRYIVGMNK
jgi:hypothetical protein